MKYIIAIIAALTVAGFAIPQSASADPYCHGSRRIVSYRPCGAPIYAVYNVSYHHGRQYGQWVTQNTACGCSACNPRSSHHGGQSSYYSSRFGPSYGRSGYSACPPQRPSYGRSSGFFFRFGR